MTEQDRQHALRVVNHASESIFTKYAAGIKEHGGHLPCKGGLHGEAWAEDVDLSVYLSTLREQLVAIHANRGEHPQEAASALRLLLYGDPSDTLPGTVIKP